MANYLFLDVETPNRQNNKICSIGLVLNSADGEHIFEEHYYINPQQGFDEQNIEIHGITPSHVKDAPTFPALWNEVVSSMLQDAIIVAHNASFDLGVLGKTLDTYSISKPPISYIDTLAVSKHFLDLPDYKLPTISQELNVELSSHHDALADAKACCEVFWKLASNISVLEKYADTWYWNDYDPTKQKCSSCDSILTDLYGIALGISADRLLYADEVKGLVDWLKRNNDYGNTKFLSDAFIIVRNTIADGRIDPDELQKIINFTRPFVLDRTNNSANIVKTQALIGTLRGIICDGKIHDDEATVLREWIEDLSLEKNPAVEKLQARLITALEDGVIDASEESELLELCKAVIDPVNGVTNNSGENELAIENRTFVLTGEFSYGSKNTVEKLISEHGGVIAKGVSKKVDYVVQGNEGSERYACGNYGSKILKAMELAENGHHIRILTEDELLSAFGL